MNTKRVVTILISLMVAASLCVGNFTHARAQAASDVVTFATLGKQEILLDGPVDSAGVDFNIPADWLLLAGGTVHLNMRVFVGDNTVGDTAAVAGFIDLYMNDTWMDTIALTKSGDYSVDVNIPDTAWRSADTNLPQSLRLYLHDAIRCSLVWASAGNGTWRGINVAVSPTSYVTLPHRIVTMPTDLKRFPYPMFQDTFRPDKVIIVVPEQPTEAELQAAFTVEASLARMTEGRLITTFHTAKALNITDLTGTHAIFVGRPSSFSQLSSAAFPLAPTGDTFEGPQVQPEAGILELAPSPVDPSQVWLLVSGNDDAGIIKAAQAAGSGAVRPYGPSNLAIVTSVQAQPSTIYLSDVSMADLGYGEENHSGYGLAYFTYYFDVPPTQAVTEGAYFEMTYNNSALLNFEESGVSILLNDQFVGSVRFNDRTTDLSTAQFNIPAYMFRAGKNQLLLEANLSGMTPCIPVDEIWISIKSESSLHIPSLPVSNTAIFDYDLTAYPQTLFPSLNNLAFVVSRNNPTSWEIASTIAYEIGKNTRETVIQPVVAYADAIPDGLKNNSQIIIGQPSTLPILQDLAPVLPAPFAAGTDIATENNSEFTFHVPETTPVGYLQVIPSPWNNQQVILTILGNGDQGLRSASLALAMDTVRSQLAGNIAVTYDNQVIVDRVESAPVAAAATQTVYNIQATPSSASGNESGPFKVNFFTLGLGILAIFITLALVALAVKWKKKPTR